MTFHQGARGSRPQRHGTDVARLAFCFGGIDGRRYFDCPGKPDLQCMAFEVKGGKNVGIRDMGALRDVIEDDLAMMGGLIVLEPLGDRNEQNFRRKMAQAGDVRIGQTLYSAI